VNDTTSIEHAPISERLELGALLAFAFVLPLFEAPKNLLWIAFLQFGSGTGGARDLGGPWHRTQDTCPLD
jgi:hypothetical protein